jgi:hypothetical protein
MRGRLVRIGVAAAVAVTAAGAVAAASAVASAATQGSAAVQNKWSVVTPASPSAGTSLLSVKGSATNLWVVGTVTKSGVQQPLIEHNAGSGWKLSTAPALGTAGGVLRGVSVLSGSDVWAVGSSGTNPVAVHFDGAHWKSVPLAANPAGEQSGGALFAVAAVSSTNVWAVGSRPTTDGPGVLIQHWNGHSWSFVAAPGQPPTDFNQLTGISPVSATDIWAVGSRGDDFNEPFVEHWNGTAWQVVSVPEPPQVNPDDPKDVGLASVTAVSATDVWAVGQSGLVEHFDGHAWKIVPAPRAAGDTDGTGTRWTAVSARGASDIWAVGVFGTTPLSMHWNGSAWKLVGVPAGSGTTGGSLAGVVATKSGGTTAVGVALTSTGQKALIVHNAA